MSLSTILMLAALMAALVALVWLGLGAARSPLPFRARSCLGWEWRRAFPTAPEEEIRAFLSLFVEAFAFNDWEMLKFHPDDQILAVYRALYPRRWMADALELETLAILIRDYYNEDIDKIWNDHLTLGELFKSVRGSQG
jgi:propanediol dehydratase small subunit